MSISRSRPFLTPVLVGLFLAARAIHDAMKERRIHPVSLWVAQAIFLSDNLCAAVIMPSPLGFYADINSWL